MHVKDENLMKLYIKMPYCRLNSHRFKAKGQSTTQCGASHIQLDSLLIPLKYQLLRSSDIVRNAST